MGLQGSQQVQPVRLRLAERLLMTEDDLAVVVLHLTQGDEAAPFGDRAGSVAGDLESLGVEINAGLRVRRQNAFGPPLLQGSCGSRVHILLLVVTGLAACPESRAPG